MVTSLVTNNNVNNVNYVDYVKNGDNELNGLENE
jgi:hypothetical protein